MGPAGLSALAQWLSANAARARAVFHPPYPVALKQLKRHQVLGAIPLEGEFRWVAGTLLPHAERIARFVELSRAFERALLCGDGSDAQKSLDSIEAAFGQSLWLVKHKIAYLQEFRGLEAQKAYVAHVRETSHVNAIAAYVAHYVSMRHEETVTAGRFYAQLQVEFERLSVPEDFSEYLRYHIAPVSALSHSAVASVLRHEHAGTVLDSYEALIVMARVILAASRDANRAGIFEALRPLSSGVQDPRLSALLGQAGHSHEPHAIADLIASGYDELLGGQFADASNTALSALRVNPTHPDLVVLAGRSIAFEVDADHGPDRHTLVERIVRAVKSITLRDEVADDEGGELLKIALNYFGHPWADVLAALVRETRTSDPLHGLGGAERFAALPLSVVSPLRSEWIGEPEDRELSWRYFHGRNVTHWSKLHVFARSWATLTVGGGREYGELSPDQLRLLASQTELVAGRFEVALAAAEDLGQSPIEFFRTRGLRIQCHCLLTLGRVIDCVRVMVTAFVEDYSLHDILPIAEAVRALDSEARSALKAEPTLAIAYDMYSAYCGSDLDHQLRFAYEDFLTSQGVQRPSELQSALSDFPVEQIHYFLWYVATERVMEHSLAFDGSREISEERLRICRVLRELAPEYSEVIEAEIRDLLRNLSVARQLREAEQSKVHVDRNAITRIVSASMRESYNRYVALIRHGLDAERATYNEVAHQRARAGDVQGLLHLPLPKSETIALFRTMVGEIRDQYVSNSAHGLDGYLSLRIRHGTLSGMLRGPLEASQLITPWDAAAGQYQLNEYWQWRLGGWDSQLQSAVEERLAKFAGDFDSLVEEMLRGWIQVRKQGNETGLFDFSFGEQQFALLAGLVDIDTSIEDFID